MVKFLSSDYIFCKAQLAAASSTTDAATIETCLRLVKSSFNDCGVFFNTEGMELVEQVSHLKKMLPMPTDEKEAKRLAALRIRTLERDVINISQSLKDFYRGTKGYDNVIANLEHAKKELRKEQRYFEQKFQ